MPPLSPAQLLSIARQHFDAGRLPQAQDLCRQILSANPRMSAALHLSGLIASRANKLDSAAAFLNRALELEPGNSAWQLDLGDVQTRAGHIDDAIATYRRAKELDPSDSTIPPKLAPLLLQQGHLPEAIAEWQQAAAQHSCNPEIHLALAQALQSAARFEDSLAPCNRALQLDPQSSKAWNTLGLGHEQTANLPAAIDAFQRAVQIDPNSIDFQTNLGNAFTDAGDLEAGASAYARALMLQPILSQVFPEIGHAKNAAQLESAMARCWQMCAEQTGQANSFFKLGLTFQQRGNPAAAIPAYQKAIELSPKHIEWRNNLSAALRDIGQYEAAIACLRQTDPADPTQIICHSNLLYLLHFAPHHDPLALLREHQSWNRIHAAPLKIHHRPHDNSRQPQRRLRIGYVSPDFFLHSVGRFLLQLYDAHDHEQFEIFSYSSVRNPDALTARFQKHSDHWIPTLGMRDDLLADRIRADKIDILLDLTMHMRDHRLFTFARKPAPVQITYLAYCSTTGLEAIDYRLTDPQLDPPGLTDAFYTEKSLRLPQTYWCYHPGIEAPKVNELPALKNNHITFASLNAFCKVTPAAINLWIKLLEKVPNSRLHLHTQTGRHRQHILDQFTAQNIAPERITFLSFQSLPHYFAQYDSIDIALDTFPYPGGTTTCDALWMGVPTISLIGSAGYTRSGLSILSNIGLKNLATANEKEYLQTAINLASDLPGLANLRSTLRDRLKSSPLMNAPQFARDVEVCYRTAWKRWCNTPTHAGL
jgi:protein O-GlcNAc transferase